jgi:hypothetical protein
VTLYKRSKVLSTDRFKKKYGHPEWPLLYRDGAAHTSPFGLQVLPQENRFRIHNATDRGWSARSGYRIWCPFEVDEAEYITEGYEKSFGTILRLFVKDADFELRVMHILPEEIDPKFLELVQGNSVIDPGTYIGMAGDAGLSHGRHTHTELVSLGAKSSILQDLVYEHGNGHKAFEDFSQGYVQDWLRDYDLSQEVYTKQRQVKGITVLNNYLCKRKDYLTGGWRTFYDSKKLFNGL